MNRNVRNLLLLIFLIVIPFLIYAFRQIKSLEEDQQRAATIYEKQMETALFSLNQYADDMMEQWVRRLSTREHSIHKNAHNLVLGTESIQMLVLRDMATDKKILFPNDYIKTNDETEVGINKWYEPKDSLLNQLTKYLAAGFQKIQSADDWLPIDGLRPSQSGITVMVYDQDSVLYNALFIFEPEYWVEQLIGGKMSEIAQDEFRLAALHQPLEMDQETSIIYNTEPFELTKDYVARKLWILSDVHLAIQSKGVNYAELIQQRSRTNLYILFFSIITLFVGAIIMIRNIRSALRIAQLKSDFVSNVSHEIRTPLSLIKMYAETLMLGRIPSEERKKHYYQVIHHESGRLTYMVNNILDFSKIEANKKTYTLSKRDMNALVQRIYTSYAHTFKEQKVSCELMLHPSPTLINVDVDAFELAFSNLLENGIKFSDKEKDIKIKTYIKDDYAHCDVTDQGIGIPKNEQDKIFDKFYRVEDALTQKTKGTGLGLSLVKHIMEAHDGKLNLISKPNKGSTFTLSFPLKKEKV